MICFPTIFNKQSIIREKTHNIYPLSGKIYNIVQPLFHLIKDLHTKAKNIITSCLYFLQAFALFFLKIIINSEDIDISISTKTIEHNIILRKE